MTYFSTNQEYTGEFNQNQRHGLGTLKTPDGQTKFGRWVNDKFES